MSSASDPDLTRKQRREHARTERKALQEAEAANAKRRTRLIQLGVLIAVVAAIIVAIVLATGSGSKKAVKVGSSQANATTAEVGTLLNGIPQSANVLGSPKALLTLKYYGDLECPICRDFTLGALPAVIQKYVRTGKLKIEYLSLETATKEQPTFQTQQTAAYAAGMQNRAWYFIELFYHEQGEEGTGYVNESYLQGLAQQVPGLDLTKWSSDRNNSGFTNQIVSDGQAALHAGFTGTPSFELGKTNGTLEKVRELSTSELHEASAYFEPTIEKLLKG